MAGALDSDFLMWKQPVKTGGALVAMNALFYALTMFQMAPFLCNLGMAAIFAGLAIKFCAPTVADKDFDLMPKEAVVGAVDAMAKAINVSTKYVWDTALWKSDKTTVKALVVLEVARRIAPYISIMTLIVMACNGVFVVPYVLETKKEMIEKTVEPHFQMLKAKKDELLKKVPKLSDIKPELADKKNE